MKPDRSLKHGASFPYDASDEWWYEESEASTPPPAATDWAHAAARGIVANLKDRRGIKDGFNRVDEDVRREIVEDIATIIRLAKAESTTE